MKEHPILFSGEMVRAILEGRKTQTRRIVKPQPFIHPKWGLTWEPKGHASDKPSYVERNCNWNPITKAFADFYRDRGGSPYGQPGDRLWVREAWMPFGTSPGRVAVGYKATNDIRPDGVSAFHFGAERWFPASDELYQDFKCDIERMEVEGDSWRPSIHMPRWASRITLEITGIRVERLQDISEEDAKAEGCEPRINGNDCGEPTKSYRTGYCYLWRDINGLESWQQNPWVWVITFKRIQP